MVTQHIPTPEEVLALLRKSGEIRGEKSGFTEAFKLLYPTLSEESRTQLLNDILACVDALLHKPSAKAA